MKTYSVYEPETVSPDAARAGDETVFVREGFAVLALLFSVVWFAWHRLWLVLLGYVVALVLLDTALIGLGVPKTLTVWIELVVGIFVAFEANNFRRWTLERNGYREVATVSGRSLEECELKYFHAWSDGHLEVLRAQTNLTPTASEPAHAVR